LSKRKNRSTGQISVFAGLDDPVAIYKIILSNQKMKPFSFEGTWKLNPKSAIEFIKAGKNLVKLVR